MVRRNRKKKKKRNISLAFFLFVKTRCSCNVCMEKHNQPVKFESASALRDHIRVELKLTVDVADLPLHACALCDARIPFRAALHSHYLHDHRASVAPLVHAVSTHVHRKRKFESTAGDAVGAVSTTCKTATQVVVTGATYVSVANVVVTKSSIISFVS